jgi:hypothetical protein
MAAKAPAQFKTYCERPPQLMASFISNVTCWHKADISIRSEHVRLLEKTGSDRPNQLRVLPDNALSIERPKFNSRVIYFCGAVKTSLTAKIIRRFQSPPVVVSDVLKPPGWRHYRVHIGQRNLQPRFWKHSRIFTY